MVTSKSDKNISDNHNTPWHPRISPYRFIVFSTTFALGTAKTLGNPPTTLEWVGGTVLSILLFSVSNYDNDSTFKPTTPPSWLGWLFNLDCMSIAWSLLSVLSISRPHYVSDERVSHSLSYPHPPITVYRVLVCAVVTTFGLVKAVLNYQNVKAPAIPWIDWAMAVPVFSTLYGLGLYEYNSAGIWAPFFVVDRTEILFSVITGALNILALLLCIAWSYLLGYTMTLFSYHPSLLSELLHGNHTQSVGAFYKLLAHEFLLGGVMAGIFMFLFLIRRVVLQTSHRNGLFRRTTRMMSQTALGIVRWRGLSSRNEQRNIKTEYVHEKQTKSESDGLHLYIDLVLYIFAHLCSHMFGIAVCLTLPLPGSPFFIGNVLTTLISDSDFDSRPWGTSLPATALTWGLHALGILFCVGFSLALMVGTVLGAIVMIILMLEPFVHVYSHGLGRESYGRAEALKERLIGLGPLERLL